MQILEDLPEDIPEDLPALDCGICFKVSLKGGTEWELQNPSIEMCTCQKWVWPCGCYQKLLEGQEPSFLCPNCSSEEEEDCGCLEDGHCCCDGFCLDADGNCLAGPSHAQD